MQDKPNAMELLESMQDFLMKDVLPEFKENEMLSYKTLVSWNMLGIIIRELRTTNLSIELEKSMEKDKQLAKEIRDNGLSIEDEEIWNQVKESILEQLKVSNPKIL